MDNYAIHKNRFCRTFPNARQCLARTECRSGYLPCDSTGRRCSKSPRAMVTSDNHSFSSSFMSQISTPSMPQSACFTTVVLEIPSTTSTTVLPGQYLHHSAPSPLSLWHSLHTSFCTCKGGGASIMDSTIACICRESLRQNRFCQLQPYNGWSHFGILSQILALFATCERIQGTKTFRR